MNPNHLKARLRLGEWLIDEGKIEEAIREFEYAYQYDEDEARYPLVQTLQKQCEILEKSDRSFDALRLYDRILEVLPTERLAETRKAAILNIIATADKAMENDDFLRASRCTRILARMKRLRS